MKLNEVTNDPINENGIFVALAKLNKLSFLTDDIAKNLDIEYYFNHSGEKTVAPIVRKLYLLNSSIMYDKLAEIIYLRFGDNWTKLYKAYIEADYNPIENYSMTENEKTNSKVKVSSNDKDGRYGFNSDTSVPTNESSTETVSEGSEDDNRRTLTKSGNIGVTTSQSMMQAEIKLRQWNFYESLFEDVDKVLALSIYS